MNEKTETVERSLVIPIYKNEENIYDLLDALKMFSKKMGDSFEVVFVVDGSPDNSYKMLYNELKQLPFKCQLVSLSRNFGAFMAIRTGMLYARGNYLAVMAADLQEPIDLIEKFYITLENKSADVVFGQRVSREDPLMRKILANIYWYIYKKTIIPEIPKGGVDVFGCNKKVREAVLAIEEPNSSLIAQLFWVGYSRLFIPYGRLTRYQGKSAWGLQKRIKYMLDSIFSYSDFPILLVLWLGLIGLMLSFFVGLITLIAKLIGWIDVPGYTTIVLGVTFFGSAILVTQGILGSYIWRALENSKKRPLSLVTECISNYNKTNNSHLTEQEPNRT